MEELKDKICVCKDCHRKFPFTVREQKIFGQRGWADPVRCHYCQRQKKVLNLILRDGVNVSEEIKSSEICDKCGRSFFSKIQRKSGVNLYCDDCWLEIKTGKQNEN
jgi:NAD-dependent SIR2 family protein deacetylase